jgi:VWFA-related protein
MRHVAGFRAVLIVLASAGIIGYAASCRPALAQSPDREKPALKEFGSSLKRLKWDPAKQTAVEIGTRDQGTGATGTDDVVRVETRLVVCDVLVTDKQGRTVSGLKESDFSVTEDGKAQQISHFSVGDDVSVERSIVLIIDYSFSQVPYIDTSVEAAKLLVDKLGPKDRMAIVTDDIRLLVDFTRNKDELKDALESLKKRIAAGQTGGSSQFSALMAAVREMLSVEDIRPIVIFQTDGDELQFLQPPGAAIAKLPQWRYNIKEYSVNDISTAAEKSRATIYSIVSGIRFLGLPLAEQMKRARIFMEKINNAGFQLEGKTPSRQPTFSDQMLAHNAQGFTRMQSAVAQVAESTGGWTAYLEQPDQAEEIYSRILSDVNHRYVIGYYPANKPHDGKRHRVSIEVRDHPEYMIEGRKTYIAPEPEQ